MQTDWRRGGREMVLLVALSFCGASGYLRAQNQPPAAVSVTPSSGTGASQTFSFLYSDPNGFADLVWAQMAVNTILNGVPHGPAAHQK